MLSSDVQLKLLVGEAIVKVYNLLFFKQLKRLMGWYHMCAIGAKEIPVTVKLCSSKHCAVEPCRIYNVLMSQILQKK